MSNADCGATEYCHFAAHDCGNGGEPGTCVTRPVAGTCALSTTAIPPVCACPGVVYHDVLCTLAADGFDLDTQPCPLQLGYFQCGARFCDTSKEVCAPDTSAAGGTCVAKGTAACSTDCSMCVLGFCDGGVATCDGGAFVGWTVSCGAVAPQN
jgi:hypothetical protein